MTTLRFKEEGLFFSVLKALSGQKNRFVVDLSWEEKGRTSSDVLTPRLAMRKLELSRS